MDRKRRSSNNKIIGKQKLKNNRRLYVKLRCVNNFPYIFGGQLIYFSLYIVRNLNMHTHVKCVCFHCRNFYYMVSIQIVELENNVLELVSMKMSRDTIYIFGSASNLLYLSIETLN